MRAPSLPGPVALTALSLVLVAACASPVGVDPIPPRDFQRQETANAISAGVPSA
jgi:hypothetical protein